MTFISKSGEKKVLAKPFCKYPQSMFYHYGYTYPNVKIDPTFVKKTYPSFA